MTQYKFYFDKQPIHSYDELRTEVDKSLFHSLDQETNQLFIDLDHHTKEIAYKYEPTEQKKVYKNCLGYSLTLLLPRTILKNQYTQLIKQMTKQVLEDRVLPSFGYIKRKGNARFLVLVFAQRSYSKVEKEVTVLRTNTSYRNSITKRICSATDPHAEVYYKVGDVKSSYLSKWSKKKRLFEMPMDEFKLFRLRIDKLFYEVLVKLNVIERAMNFFTGIKQFKYERKGKRMVYINMNINTYNAVIYEMNHCYNKLYEIVYSPAKFYQDKDILQAFQELQMKYRMRLKYKKFTYKKKVKLSISPYYRRDYFIENMESFLRHFKQDCREFLIKNINMDIMSM